MGDQQLQSLSLFILAAIAVVAALIYTQPVMVPLVFALFLYSFTGPLINTISSKIPRALSITALMLFVFLIIGGGFFFISLSIDNFIENLPLYREQLYSLISDILAFLESMSIEVNQDNIREGIKNLPFISYLKKLSAGIFSIIGNSLLIVIMLSFLLLGEPQKQSASLKTIQKQISYYIGIKLSISLLTGLLVGCVLMLFRIDLALMFAVLTFMLNFIPSIGSIIATLLPIPLILIKFGLGWQTMVCIGLMGLIQITIGQFIEPRLMGNTLRLHPVTILAFLIFWGLVWGIPGMFMAVPMTAALKLILENIKPTQKVAKLLEGEWVF